MVALAKTGALTRKLIKNNAQNVSIEHMKSLTMRL